MSASRKGLVAGDHRRPQIAVILRSLTIGGAERALLRIAGWLASQGVDVEVVEVVQTDATAPPLPAGVTVRRLGRSRLRTALASVRHYLRVVRPKVVLVTGPHLSMLVAAAHRTVSADGFLIVRASNRLGEPAAAGHLPAQALTRVAARAVLASADAVVAPSRSLADELAHLIGTERVHVIPNPIGPPEAAASSTIDGHTTEGAVVGCGRLVSHKGWRLLLQSLALCDDLTLRLVLVGDGPDREALERTVDALGLRDRVTFVGETTEPQRWMAGARAVALPSLWEGQPNVVLEALALGCHVIGTDAPGGTAEMLRAAGAGVTVPPADAFALASALDASAQEPPPRPDLERHLLENVGAAYLRVAGIPPPLPTGPTTPTGEAVRMLAASDGARATERPPPTRVVPRLQRVVHIITTAGVGGAERTLLRLLPELGQHAEQHVIVLGGARDLEPAFRSAGAQVYHLAGNGPRGVLPGVRALRKHLASAPPGTVVQTWLYHADVAGVIASRTVSAHLPVVWNLRNVVLQMGDLGTSTRLAFQAARRLARRGPAAIVACDHQVRLTHAAAGYPLVPMRVLPNPIVPLPTELEGTRSLRAELGIPDGAPVAARIARFHPAKDYPTLVAAMRILAETGHPDLHVLLVGNGTDGEEARRLTRRCGGRVQYHHLGLRSDVARVYDASDVTCSTSRGMEGFPNVVAESIVAGTPVVTSNVGAARHLVGDAGRVVDLQRPEAYAAALAVVLEDEAMFRTRAQQRAQTLRQRYPVDRVAAAYTNLYREVLATNGQLP